jgi:hypothetical protein
VRTPTILYVSALAAAQLAAGCSEETLSPVAGATEPTPTVTTAGSGGSGAGGNGETGPKVREVFYRNTVGVPFDNLLADGDVELSIVAGDGQYGWLAFQGNGAPTPLFAETGGICRSGLRCGRAGADNILFVRGTAAPNMAPHRASVWMKPVAEGPDPEGLNPCRLADVRMVKCDNFDIGEKLEPASAPTPDGWCEISGPVDPSTRALCLYIEIDRWEVLVDAATLLPVEDSGQRSPPPPMRPDQLERAAIVREHIRSKMTFSSDSVPIDPIKKMREARGD